MRPRRRNRNNINKIFERLLLQSVTYVCDWMSLFAAYQKEHPELAAETVAIQHREPPQGWDKEIPTFPPDPKGIASRDSSGKVLNAIAKNHPWLVGGSADLSPSTKTRLTFPNAGE
jgi:transketolase